ncbi:hypothetical protein HYPBUDRAFT_217168 [Hyphopichia burtonii NRRL Y-1933]|uniref:Uncharacterized protein n=1 Tax=Hyphopichia burtonii NRRL Y-1933 TaxID=984485 RepID=A0A1E4RHC1_9ASCO|nr:hypothetical protein HYPBUDRAFT_217168 [Hyphopichia burtonii NRRL Y-1933]ODV66664.1 hypothetical protein HYPBUDRAFT_217168 [Hyphopichia burtonii NRRL Y-1933]
MPKLLVIGLGPGPSLRRYDLIQKQVVFHFFHYCKSMFDMSICIEVDDGTRMGPNRSFSMFKIISRQLESAV